MRSRSKWRRTLKYALATAAAFVAMATITAMSVEVPPTTAESPRVEFVAYAGQPQDVRRATNEELRAYAAQHARRLEETPEIAKTLDAFHAAAAAAAEETYFALLADNAVFLGTDATERWTKSAFREYAHPHFAAGKGWTYHPRDRVITLSAKGDVAWFDELLDADHMGVCRGSGVLEKHGDAWLITQYNLSVPIPNDLAKDFVARIREFERGKPDVKPETKPEAKPAAKPEKK